MTNEHIQKLLHNYVEMILKCENIIEKRYGLESIPYMNKDKIPKSNKVEFEGVQLEYNFHGIGCTFILGSIELDYSIYIDREDYIVVSPWGFMQFINSSSTSGERFTEAQITGWLEMLNANGIIKKIYDEYFVYEVSFKWYNTFK